MKQSSLPLFGDVGSYLPETATTRSGVEFSPRGSIWQYRDGLNKVHLDFGQLAVPEPTLRSVRQFFFGMRRTSRPATW